MSDIIMNNTGIGIIKNKNDNIQLILCHNNATYEYTSSVAPRHTQRKTSQAHKTQTKNKRIKRSLVCNVIRRWYISIEIQYLTNNILKFM